MMQVCNDTYWEWMLALKPPEAPCGMQFDDLYQYTFCPHKFFLPTVM